MRDFIRFLKKSHFFLLFLLLESISVILVVRNNDKSGIFISSANSVSGFFNRNLSQISDYFSLREQNKNLISENERLKNYISAAELSTVKYSDELDETGYFYKTAEVIKNSVHKPYNIITLNKGEKNGIHEDMAVISDGGVVGIVTNVSNNYCTVVSLLNTKLGINAKIKRTGYFGTLQWENTDYRYATLQDIRTIPRYISEMK